jgi:membrane protein implicated in regulation of membrane protease activity
MPTHVSDAARDVAEHASSVARLELELAALELKTKVAALGVGIGLAGGAAVLALYMLGFGLATAAAGLATFLPWWLSLLVVTGFLAVLVTLLAGLGIGRIRKGTPPLPEQAIREAKLTTAAIKS